MVVDFNLRPPLDEFVGEYKCCLLYTSCPYAMDICDKKKPEKFYFSDDHYARCHRYDVRDTEEKL